MDRRGFLASLLSSAVATATLDVEKLLWIPGEKVYFDIVQPGHFPDAWVSEAARRMADAIDARAFERLYAQLYPAGEIITVRVPQRWRVA